MTAPAEPSTTPSLVTARGLRFDSGHQAVLRGLDFALRPGRVTAFLGRNGAGKSTTLALLAGLLAPSAGTVRVDGGDPCRSTAARARIGFLPERPPLYPQLDVREHLAHAARLRHLPRRALSGAVERAVERFDLAEQARRPAGRLSKGMQQRLGLAMALIADPAIVLLDEPGSGLDPVQQRRLREIIMDLTDDGAAADGVAVLYSTHMLDEALAVADDLLILSRGRLTFAGEAATLRKRDDAANHLLALMSGETEPKPKPEPAS